MLILTKWRHIMNLKSFYIHSVIKTLLDNDRGYSPATLVSQNGIERICVELYIDDFIHVFEVTELNPMSIKQLSPSDGLALTREILNADYNSVQLLSGRDLIWMREKRLSNKPYCI